MLTAHLHPGPRLRMSGAVPPLSLQSFMVCTGELYVLPIMAVWSIMTDGHFGLIKKL